MGCGPSSPVDKAIAKRKELTKDEVKLLLLGPGGSGKSTIFKQTIQLRGEGFSEDEKKTFIPLIHDNIVSGMLTLVTESRKLATTGHADTAVSTENQPLVESFLKCADEDDEGNPTIDIKHFAANVDNITQLWTDPGIRATYDKSNLFQLPTSASYFFDNLARVAAATYVPTESDIMQTRKPTRGIVETTFFVDGVKFILIDVGGQRNERKKWMSAFSDVTMVLFVAAINEYDQMLEEDETTNRLIEALDLFGQTCNSGWFGDKNPPIMLFLNKSDLFREKIQKADLNVLFPEYTGGRDYTKGVEFLEKLFLERNRESNTDIYCRQSVATSAENTDALLQVVTVLVRQKNLDSMGLA
jgi:GTPase SAR1 family protein